MDAEHESDRCCDHDHHLSPPRSQRPGMLLARVKWAEREVQCEERGHPPSWVCDRLSLSLYDRTAHFEQSSRQDAGRTQPSHGVATHTTIATAGTYRSVASPHCHSVLVQLPSPPCTIVPPHSVHLCSIATVLVKHRPLQRRTHWRTAERSTPPTIPPFQTLSLSLSLCRGEIVFDPFGTPCPVRRAQRQGVEGQLSIVISIEHRSPRGAVNGPRGRADNF